MRRKIEKSDKATRISLEILGIDSGCDQLAVKKAYRRKALICHPDKGGSNGSFIAIKEAYDYLRKFGTEFIETRQQATSSVTLQEIIAMMNGMGIRIPTNKAYDFMWTNT